MALTGSATGSVTAAGDPPVVLAAILVSPSAVQVYPGDQIRFTAKGLMSDSSFQPVSVTWSVDNGSIDANGVLTAGGVGSYVVTATQA